MSAEWLYYRTQEVVHCFGNIISEMNHIDVFNPKSCFTEEMTTVVVHKSFSEKMYEYLDEGKHSKLATLPKFTPVYTNPYNDLHNFVGQPSCTLYMQDTLMCNLAYTLRTSTVFGLDTFRQLASMGLNVMTGDIQMVNFDMYDFTCGLEKIASAGVGAMVTTIPLNEKYLQPFVETGVGVLEVGTIPLIFVGFWKGMFQTFVKDPGSIENIIFDIVLFGLQTFIEIIDVQLKSLEAIANMIGSSATATVISDMRRFFNDISGYFGEFFYRMVGFMVKLGFDFLQAFVCMTNDTCGTLLEDMFSDALQFMEYVANWLLAERDAFYTVFFKVVKSVIDKFFCSIGLCDAISVLNDGLDALEDVVKGIQDVISSIGSVFSGWRRLAEQDHEKEPLQYIFEVSKLFSWDGKSECDFIMNNYVFKNYNHTTLRPLEQYHIATCLQKRLIGYKMHSSWRFVPEDVVYNNKKLLRFIYKLMQGGYYYITWSLAPSLYDNELRKFTTKLEDEDLNPNMVFQLGEKLGEMKEWFGKTFSLTQIVHVLDEYKQIHNGPKIEMLEGMLNDTLNIANSAARHIEEAQDHVSLPELWEDLKNTKFLNDVPPRTPLKHVKLYEEEQHHHEKRRLVEINAKTATAKTCQNNKSIYTCINCQIVDEFVPPVLNASINLYKFYSTEYKKTTSNFKEYMSDYFDGSSVDNGVLASAPVQYFYEKDSEKKPMNISTRLPFWGFTQR